MAVTRPLRIGISACFFHADPTRPVFKGKTLLYLEESLVHWVMGQDVLAYLIPSVAHDSPLPMAKQVQDLDALVLQGGSDVSPTTYGEAPLKPEWAGDHVRDLYEMSLIREFVRVGKPVLGICRGLQILNVAYGGTLYQDIATQLPEALNHRNWDIYDQNFHNILFEPGSEIAKLYPGSTVAKVNTVHHQAIKALGKDLVIEARSEVDGLVEAIRLKGSASVYAIQWHPEFQHPGDLSLLSGTPILFEFLKEARRRRGG